MAKKLLRENTLSIPNTSWREYRDADAVRKQQQTKTEKDVSKDSESGLSPEHSSILESDDVERESYVIHPDLDDDQDWSWWIKFQSSVGNLLMKTPEEWKTVSKRKELGGKALDRIGFLFAAYKIKYWYWELLEMLRK